MNRNNVIVVFIIAAVIVIGGVIVYLVKKPVPPNQSVMGTSTLPASVNVPVTVEGLKITAVNNDSVVAEVLVKKEFLSAEAWAKRAPKQKPAVMDKKEEEDDMIEVDEETGLPIDD